MTPTLSIVTGTRNRPRQLLRLCNSIAAHTVVDWELIIADASDEPLDTLGFPSNVRVLPERPRLGCSRAYNRAFSHARGEWVIWLNDDCEVMPGYDTAAIAFMEAHPQIGLGALHYSENDGPFHVNSAWGCIYPNFGIISRELGNKVGWFDDECVVMYGCDNTLALRVLLADKGIADIPNARVLHHSEQDAERRENQKNRLADNQRLQAKYMPLRHIWLANFRKHALPSPFVPWPHGARPKEQPQWVGRG